MTSDELIRGLVTDLRPVRRLRSPRARAVLWACIGVAYVSVSVAVLSVKAGRSGSLPDAGLLQQSSILSVVFACSAWSAFELSVPGLRTRGLRALLSGCGVLAWFACIVSLYPGELSGSLASSTFWSSGTACIQRSAWLAFGPALSMFVMLRRAAPLEHARTGALAALAAVALALLGTQLLCDNHERGHLLLWHFGALIAAAVAGMGAGRLLFSQRPMTTL